MEKNRDGFDRPILDNEKKDTQLNTPHSDTHSKIDDCDDGLPNDTIARHNIITRLMALVVIFIFAYTFIKPLPIGYVEIITYAMVFIFLIITFGLNSLKVVGSLIDKWKR